MQSPKLSATARFCVASSKIVWQAFEDELVVINLESGTYYSLDRAGAVIWRLVEAGASAAEAVGHVLKSGAPPEARDQVLEFWAKLLEEGLISAALDGAEPKDTSGDMVVPWAPPSITVYTDMQDLFLLDPIHDVDEAGWPSRPAETP